MKYSLITVSILSILFSFSIAFAGNVSIGSGEFISVSGTDVQKIVVTCPSSKNKKKAKVGVSWNYIDQKDGKNKETEKKITTIKCNDKEQQLIAPTINEETAGAPSIMNYGPGYVVVKW